MTFAMAVGFGGTASAAESVLVIDPGDRPVRNNGAANYKGVIGYDITVGSADARVTHLGVWDGPGNQDSPDTGEVGDGLEQSAVVGLYESDTHKLIAQATVPAGADGELEGEFRYMALDEPVTLVAGQVYRIAMGVDSGGNAFRNDGGGRTGPTFSQHFAIARIAAAYHDPRGAHDKLVVPNQPRAGSAYMGPSFRYTGGGDIPPPVPTEDPGARLADAESRPGAVVLAESFEHFVDGSLPQGWAMVPSPPSDDRHFSIAKPGAGTAGRALQLERSPHVTNNDQFGGLTYRLPKAADRVAVSFDYKPSARHVNSPSLEVFTLAPDSTEPTQLHLRVHRNRLQQYGGIQIGWVNLPTGERQSGQRITDAPWYRVRFVIDRDAEGMDVYISPPDQPDLPDQPVATAPVYRPGEPIAAIRFGMANLRSNDCLIDNLEIRIGDEIPAPGEPQLKPDLTEGFQLWTGETFPRSFSEIDYPQGIEHHIIYPRIAPWRWYHGTSIEFHKGKLYASWAANDRSENQPGEVVLYNTSSDGGRTWSEAKVLAPGDGKGGTEYSNSHGTLLSHNGQLWGFFQHWAGGWDNPLSTEAFILNEQTGQWESQGIVATRGWPLDRPKRTADGNWVMGVSGFKMWQPGAMISDGDNLLKWDTVAIPTERENRFPETSLIVDGNDVWSITRWGGESPMVSTSSDGGRTWAMAEHGNLPMAGSKPDSGTLSTGQWFIVINMKDRDALIIAVGKPGEHGVSKLYKVRYGSPPVKFGYDGPSHPGSYAYPYCVEHDGRLYVTYSINKADVEVAIIPIEALTAQ